MENMNAAHLILLLLPGFWSLWMYAPFTSYDFNNMEWQEKLMIALGLGVLNLLLLAVINMYIYRIDTVEQQIIILRAVSLSTGFLSGLLAKKELSPNMVWHKFIAQKGREPAATPYEKALDYYNAHYNDLYENTPYAIMKVYPVGAEDKANVGYYRWGYAKTGEVLLTHTSILKEIDLTHFQKSVVINDPASSRIFEIYPLTEKEMLDILEERELAFTSV